jgi:hypothetical protein
MAERRMFAMTIIDSDAFLEMPATTQLLYFHLSMRADDDGFINKPKTIMRTIGCKDDDINLLIAKKFIIPFETGIVVIKHWKIHNYIQKDRYKKTKYSGELAQLSLDDNRGYTLENEECIQSVSNMDTQVRLGKVSIGNSKDICANPEEDESQIDINAFDKEIAFATFWKEYPRKRDKDKAYTSFIKVCKTEEMLKTILDALKAQKQDNDWIKENGRYVPYPTTWLNGKRWKDEINNGSNEQPRYENTSITRI